MTDPSTIATWLAPILPYLLKGGVELAKSAAGELGKKISADAWEGLKRLAGKIQQKAKGTPAEAALQRAARAPDDARVRGMVELYLEDIFNANPDLLAEAAQLAALLQQAGTSYHAELHGDGAIAQGPGATAVGPGGVYIGGNAQGNIIVTGDENQVTQAPGEKEHGETG